MDKEDFLKSKYMVIADYPFSKLSLGQILYKHVFNNGNYLYTTNPNSLLEGIPMKKENVESYPHLFQPLQWWEQIEHKDRPKYIKWVDPVDKTHIGFFKVDEWGSNPNTSEIQRVYTGDAYLFIEDCFPATESDYQQFLKRDTNK